MTFEFFVNLIKHLDRLVVGVGVGGRQIDLVLGKLLGSVSDRLELDLQSLVLLGEGLDLGC